MKVVSLIIVAVLSILIPLISYFKNFKGVSWKNADWGAFGSYFGGVSSPFLSLLGFFAVLYTIKRQGKEAQEGNRRLEQKFDIESIHKLIEYHYKKVDSMRINKEVFGNRSFSTLISQFKSFFIAEISQQMLLRLKSLKLSKEDTALFKSLNISPNTNLSYFFPTLAYNEGEDKPIELKELIRRENLLLQQIIAVASKDEWQFLFATIFTKQTKDIQLQLIQNTLEGLYVSLGQQYSGYLRNVYYVLESISTISEEKGLQLSKVFRAQLTKDEVSFLWLNNLSPMSSHKFIQLLEDFNILDDVDFDNIVRQSFGMTSFSFFDFEDGQDYQKLAKEYQKVKS